MSKLIFTQRAATEFEALKTDESAQAVYKAVRKALGYLELNPRHPSLETHEYTSMTGVRGEKVFEAYAQNQTPGAYRIFWHYGPDELKDNPKNKPKERVAVITIVATTPHP